jgi:hypothetical protein
MIRRFFTFLSGLSLLLCLATCAMWGRSYSCHPYASECTVRGKWGIMLHRGKVFAMWSNVVSPHAYDDVAHPLFWGEDDLKTSPDVFGAPWSRHWKWGKSYYHWTVFQYGAGGLGGAMEHWLAFPAWLIACATLIAPLWWLRRWRTAWVTRRDGQCAQCGYDLRATPNRCPECGAVPSRLKVQA